MNLSNILQKSLAIRHSDKVLIITDSKRRKIAEKFFQAAKKLSSNTRLLVKSVERYNGEEPPAFVAEQMKKSDVVIAVTTYSTTHTKARIAASKRGARIATLPGFTEEMFPVLQTNPFLLKKTGERIAKALSKAEKLYVTTKSGTEISLSIRKPFDIDDGVYRKKGAVGNLPAGEICFAPLEGTANGTIVVDSMHDGKEVFVKPVTVISVKNGKAVKISDSKSELAKYFKTIKNARNIAELGIGTNPKAKVIGHILEDEKAIGTCHMAFGNSIGLGGKIYSKIHIDAILFKPTIWADDKMIMKNGKLMI